MKVGFLGSGSWGMALVKLITENKIDVLLWSIEQEVLDSLEKENRHPKFEKAVFNNHLSVTRNLDDVLGCDVIIECVTAKGLRPVLEKLTKSGKLKVPFILSSKGIEFHSGKILSEVAEEILGPDAKMGYISGPTLADEVLSGHPTCAVAGSKERDVQKLIRELFEGENFRITGSFDFHGVALGGAMKNVIAIAAGMATGLGYGFNTKAMLLTKGLDELKKMAVIKGCREETMNTLSGIGDLIVTGVTPLSRNYRFGRNIGQGMTVDEAKAEIGMVVEGEYTVKAAYQLMQGSSIVLPITDSVYKVLNEGELPKEAIRTILQYKSVV
ncbi:MAG: Glycerol-3-phosphate dehydrogenase [NAD(P)+] [Chlamydiia bacterium]|nr:Glycerol-3-phosphate dehydrogenase [NAD(P)+] [Chlamydiia bacterium]MCH9618375.1 Glycerol-3-phosphate dehydrogenase [NAD(P)+] [Chlamydiia bacterium]MCH9624094.1 Glycerol-3-phosphate dehydrogenase [NAD(P)+] [Chlamydiia bacterium]